MFWPRPRGPVGWPWVDVLRPVHATDVGSAPPAQRALHRAASVRPRRWRLRSGVFAPRHRDMGSCLTMSVLLSDPAEMLGGEFVVERRGACDACPGPR